LSLSLNYRCVYVLSYNMIKKLLTI